MPYEPVHDCNQIDLTRHGLIEASAGTGKTYTIENLVVRLLKERVDIELENILLVTFTEKATSEMKIRIREKLEKALNGLGDDPETAKRIKDALDTFDQASIFTIHGFCQMVLKDFAFENRTTFQSEVINDTPLFETLLKEQMRKGWPKMFGNNLREVLEVSGFNEEKDAFLETVISLAKSFHERASHRMLPDLKGEEYQEIKGRVKATCLKLKALVGSGGKFSEGFAKLNIHGMTKKALLRKIISPIEEFFSEVDGDNLNLKALMDLISDVQKTRSKDKKGIQCLDLDWGNKDLNPNVCANLESIKAELKRLIAVSTTLKHVLAIRTIHQLQKDVSQVKQNHGWISYHDMLALVEKAINTENFSNQVQKLRNKYRVAFIDEFQDTDPIQWAIFRTLFIGNERGNPENIFFLIGDPKQAIYSFRGADVYAFLSARNEMERLAKEGKAKLYSLSINWRSRPELITSFNRLFCCSEWFKPHGQTGEFEIGYQDADFPEKREDPGAMTGDHSARPVLNIVDLSEAPNPGSAKPLLAKFIAYEIQYLVDCGITLNEKGGDGREFDFGDICILVRGKNDVPFIEEELLNLGIPYTFYKKPGLFLSDEAGYLGLVFHAILDPGDSSEVKKALLTPFFGIERSKLFLYEELPPSHPVKELFFRWNRYAVSRRWSRLFQSLMEDSGLISRETAQSNWDRKYTNYRQIFEHMGEEAYKKNLDFRTLSATLDTYRTQAADAGEDADIHRIETEAQKVRIMTIHVSKGLQFPVVFVAGGLTRPPPGRDRYHTYHEIEEGVIPSKAIKIFDLMKSSGGERDEAEKMEENRRLYYVASTRSQYKLYLPFYIYKKNATWLGPVCRLVSPALLSSFPKSGDNKDVLWLMPDHHSGASMKIGEKDETREPPALPETVVDSLFPSQTDYRHRKPRLESFSSLHHRRTLFQETREQGIGFQSAEKKAREDDEDFGTGRRETPLPEHPPDEMPGGTEVGSMFHDILEKIDFAEVLKTASGKGGGARSLWVNPGTRGVILEQMELYRVDEGWRETVCDMIWNTLTTPVGHVEDDFILAGLRSEDRLHEVEFYYPFSCPVNEPEKVPECEITDGFIRGFVDLVFRSKQRYYIVDWKSNYIESGYDRESMETNMKHADYHLQYRLYTIAALRWLKQAMGDRFDPVRHFGGIFYFYLRGMGTGKENGVYYVSADELRPLDQLEKEVIEIIRKRTFGIEY